MHYQLFIPDPPSGPKTAPRMLEDLGLADFVAGHEAMHKPGPESKIGQLICWRKPGINQPFHFNETEQTWIPAVANGPDGEGQGRYWVGFWNDSPPSPEDLERPHCELGSSVDLGDGNSWMVPCVHNFAKDLIRDDDGSWKFEIQRKHQASWNAAQQWMNRLRDNSEFAFSELADFVESYLRLNYRLLTEVSSQLRLFSTQNLIGALAAILSTVVEGADA